MARLQSVTVTVHRLKAIFASSVVGVDRKAAVLRGYVVAQLGAFKDGRGEFDRAALEQIVRLGNASARGLKSRFAHPSLSADGVGKFLGRARDLTLGHATDGRTGQRVLAVRGDLHFDRTALEEPPGGGKPLGVYVMDLAESDPDAISTSLVLEADEEYRMASDGTPLAGDGGEALPPLWRPTRLHASDVVDQGAAVDSILSADELTRALDVGLTPELKKVLRFDRVVRLWGQLLDGLFPKSDRADIETRCRAWLDRYLDARFGDGGPPTAAGGGGVISEAMRERLNRMAARATLLGRRRG